MKIKLIAYALTLLFFTTNTHAYEPPEAPQHYPKLKYPKLKVMTYNLYVGTDLFNILRAQNPYEYLQIVTQTFQEIKDSQFTLRAQAIADEIRQKNPDLIGLQEVSLFRTQTPGDFLDGNSQAASHVALDYLQILMNALQERGLQYEVVSANANTDIETPILAGGTPENPKLDDLRFTNRDVILKKVGVETRDLHEAHFTNNLELSIQGFPIRFTRGYTSVIATVRNHDYKFVTTHLETNHNEPSKAIQSLQVAELVETLKDETLPIVLVGDFNSPPESEPSQPYNTLTTAGFVDAWTKRVYFPIFGYQQGDTCCQKSNIREKDSALNTRIDQVWVKLPNGSSFIGWPRMRVVGNQVADMVEHKITDDMSEWLWPSDHAGVFAKFWLPDPSSSSQPATNNPVAD